VAPPPAVDLAGLDRSNCPIARFCRAAGFIIPEVCLPKTQLAQQLTVLGELFRRDLTDGASHGKERLAGGQDRSPINFRRLEGLQRGLPTMPDSP